MTKHVNFDETLVWGKGDTEVSIEVLPSTT